MYVCMYVHFAILTHKKYDLLVLAQKGVIFGFKNYSSYKVFKKSVIWKLNHC